MSCQLRKHHAENSRNQFGLENKITNAHKAGEGYSKLFKHFQVSRTGVRSITQKFKDNHTVQNKPGRGKKRKISNTLERKPVRDVSKDPRTTAKTLVNDLATSAIVVSKKTITRALHRNGLQGCRPRKNPLLKKRHLQARLKYAQDNLEKEYAYWKYVLWSDETKLELFGHRNTAYVPWWWEYYGLWMLQCIWNWKSCQGGSNHERRKICGDFEAVSSKTGSRLLLHLPT